MFFSKRARRKKLSDLAAQCESAFELCEKAASIFDKPITILAYNRFRPHVQASAFDVGRGFLILLKPTLTPLALQFATLHEISHICLGHLVPISISDLIENGACENYFTPSEEQAARKLASELYLALLDIDNLSPPNTSVGARFESLFD